MKHERRTREKSSLNIWALVFGALLFMILPALFAFAGADVAETERSKMAVERHQAELRAEMSAAGFELGQPVYLQITKQPAELTAFIEMGNGSYTKFKAWPICAYSGGLGPKHKTGDEKSPEGFYSVPASAMNPASRYHLSFNLGYPNAYDRGHGRTGDYLMVHGACASIGCYAMTDNAIEAIWTLMQAAFEGGQETVPVHIFPFAMTEANLNRYEGHEASDFWQELAPAWAAFEAHKRVPHMAVLAGRYQLRGGQ